MVLLYFIPVSAADVKKLKSTVETLYLEKARTEKAEKPKKNKSKGKAKLMVEGDNVSENDELMF